MIVAPSFNLTATVSFLDPFRAANYLERRSLYHRTLIPGMLILDVALACGFASPEHFSRAYRVRFGISPREDRVEGRISFEFRAWPMHTLRGKEG